MDYQFLWRPVFDALPTLLEAAALTLEVSALSMLIGTVLGLGLYFVTESGPRIARLPARGWIEIARNTPALFQIFLFYWGFGEFGLFLSSYVAVVAALSFNTAGYMAETFRGGFAAVPPAQERAARCLGMSFWRAQRHVVVPQVLKVVYHPMTNQMVWVILNSSLGMLAGLRELAGETQFFNSKSFRTFEFFFAAAIIYYLMAKLCFVVMRLLGRGLFKSGDAPR